MKMSLLKSIYMEILLIETQTEITTFKTVMVTGWCQVTTFSKKNKKKYLFGATCSVVCYTAVFRVVTQRSSPLTLADYLTYGILELLSFFVTDWNV